MAFFQSNLSNSVKQNFTQVNSKRKLCGSGYICVCQGFLILLLSSCVTQKNLEYLQKEDVDILSYTEGLVEEYKLQPKDELYIQISSLDDPSARIFSSAGNQQYVDVGGIEPYGASLLSYTIDNDGNILLPVIGAISVKDKTTKEVSEIITKSVTKILSQPLVSVKLVNRYVTVLGEIQRPGQYIYSRDKVTIYDAIGLAGDVTDWGNRDEVILIRNKDGKNHRIHVSLIQPDILASNYLYVSPNDIIYIKPLRKKFWGINRFPYEIILSAITAGILLYSIVK
ncbi:polysaccharide export protein [Marinilabiliaceae bacterium JC017]|nr:polysaccharide export protein [Marinilabiliaceae bacterium JC017]